MLANVLDIDDDFRCNHRCNTLPHNPTYYRTVYRQGDDGSIGPVGGKFELLFKRFAYCWIILTDLMKYQVFHLFKNLILKLSGNKEYHHST